MYIVVFEYIEDMYIYLYIHVCVRLTCEQQMYGHGIEEPHYYNKPIVCCVAETIEIHVVYVIHVVYAYT